jgi:hypothetical protein
LQSFDPSALLTVSFDGVGVISPGQPLSQDQVKSVPTVSVTPANSSITETGNFTLMMVDADKVGTDDTPGVTRHWLVNSVTISGKHPRDFQHVGSSLLQAPLFRMLLLLQLQNTPVLHLPVGVELTGKCQIY